MIHLCSACFGGRTRGTSWLEGTLADAAGNSLNMKQFITGGYPCFGALACGAGALGSLKPNKKRALDSDEPNLPEPTRSCRRGDELY